MSKGDKMIDDCEKIYSKGQLFCKIQWYFDFLSAWDEQIENEKDKSPEELLSMRLLLQDLMEEYYHLFGNILVSKGF